MPTPPSSPNDDVKKAIMQFTQNRGMGQVYTVDKDGFPTGRTMGATLLDDWTTEMMQARDNGRVFHVKRHPQMAVEWNDGAVDSVNKNIPKVVFIKGTAELFEGDELVARYNARMERMAARGGGHRQQMTEEQIRANLVGIRLRPRVIRAEGFGETTQVFLWKA